MEPESSGSTQFIQASQGRTRGALGMGVRLVVCGLLLAWILHAIFMFEAIRITPEATWQTMDRSTKWAVAWKEGPLQLAGTLSQIHPGAFVVSLLVMGLILLAGVARWRMVLRVHGLNLSWGRAIEISLVAHFFNSFLLGSTGGDVMRAIYAARETRHKKTEAVITVFVDRILGLWTLLLFGCAFMLLNLGLIFSHPLLKLCCAVVVGMTLVATAVVVVALRGGISRRLSGVRQWLQRLPKAAALERSLRACRRFGRERGVLVRVLALSMILNGLCVLHVQVIANGIQGFVLDPGLTALIVPVITAVIALPITPNGLGAREFLFVKLLYGGPLTLDPNAALSLSLLAYAGSLIWSLVGGVVYLTYKRRHLLEEIAEDGSHPEGLASRD